MLGNFKTRQMFAENQEVLFEFLHFSNSMKNLRARLGVKSP